MRKVLSLVLAEDTGYLNRCLVDSPVRLGQGQETFQIFVHQSSLLLTIVHERVN